MPKQLWKPGQSGNPKGRPKGQLYLGTYLQRALNESITLANGTKIKAADAVVKKAINAALQGDTQMIKLLFDRIDGPPVQKTEVTGAEGSDLYPSEIVIRLVRPGDPDA